MKVSDLLDDALVLMGEAPEMCLPCADDAISGVSLRRRLELAIEDSARKAVAALPVECAGCLKALPAEPLEPDADGCAKVRLPPDFLKLAEVRLISWERPVAEVYPGGHWLRRLQRVAWKGLRATKQRPLAFFAAGDDGEPVLELWPAKSGDYVAEGWYVATPRIEAGEIDIPAAAYMATLNQMVENIRE